MTTQGIALLTPRTDKLVSDKETKATKATFDSFMNNQATKISHATRTEAVQPSVETGKAGEKKELAAKGFDRSKSVNLNEGAGGDQVKDSYTKQASGESVPDAERAAEIVAHTMILLQDLFGLLKEELEDIMDQFSIQPQDLLVQVQGSEFSLINQSAVQTLILGIHGVDDTAAFLTNDLLSQEFSEVTKQLTALLAELFDVPVEQLENLEPIVLSDFAGQLKQMTETAEPGAQAKDMQTEGGMPEVQEETLTVTYENVTAQTGAEDGQNQDNAMMDESANPQQTNEPLSQITAADAFTDNLVKAFEEVRDTSSVSAEATMRQIVEQVVHHVKIRVMPETTSMELQLHPASLGRVALTVTTTAAGAATASMVVENQIAKEALESQMIQLKESFAEQGLKVDAVEVTVAEFSLKKENQQQDDPTGSRKQNRKSQTDKEISEEDDTTVDQTTASERRDVNSVVDYTA